MSDIVEPPLTERRDGVVVKSDVLVVAMLAPLRERQINGDFR